MTTKLGFYGGVGSVTGANFMLETAVTRLLVDCGLVQGDNRAWAQNTADFAYDPASVDALLVTHAHADHIGRVPKLVRDGFRGTIYSTTPTRALAAIMLADAAKLMAREATNHNQPPLYAQADVEQALALWQSVDYHKTVTLPDNVTATFTDAGHILGSAMVHLRRAGKKIVFTGDIGNDPQPLLVAPEVPRDYDYLVMESVYGDRTHEEVAERAELLRQHIARTIKTNGTLLIPAFSLERTQAMLFEINNLVEQGVVEPIATFLDSPLAIAVTDVYRQSLSYLKPAVQKQIKQGDDIFAFSGLSFTKSVRDSKAIARQRGAKIIIAGSGMSHGGRIRQHEKQFLGARNTTVLLVGYQTVGSVGRLLQDGARVVKIDGEAVRVKARIARIRGYSGHADRDQLLNLVYRSEAHPKQIFVTMGEERASLHLVQRLRDYLGAPALAPAPNQVVEIDF